MSCAGPVAFVNQGFLKYQNCRLANLEPEDSPPAPVKWQEFCIPFCSTGEIVSLLDSRLRIPFMRTPTLILCLFCLTNCSIYPDKHSIFASIGMADHFSIQRHRNFVLPLASAFYIPIPVVKAQSPDIDMHILESSAELASMALSTRFPFAVMGNQPEGLSQALTTALNKQCDYVFYIDFIDVHDTVGMPIRNDWSGPGGIDRVRLKVLLAEVKGRQIIDSIDIQGESGWATFFDDRPIELLAIPFKSLSDRLSTQWH